ncbi:hypothetical protein ASD65_09900 [Microbacterium sp. Root61]|uniref:NAD(P)/FAD-dependent oxidoreductase n=1 Tax=Microbacterium sp. Root61 TaxID=1736570 RepID=UPI0006F3237E|nr:FAD-dependent oxidoreductase [Microbacterium sp. Root61]KRA24693.1 hypothetical protein ASD65_09900 [Microbacterium sp. Root61]
MAEETITIADARDLGKVVIVGAGAAGTRFAQALRRGGYDGEVVLVGDERGLPYHRPLLSKEVLSSAKEMDDIRLCSAEDLAEQQIEFVRGTHAVGLDLAGKQVLIEEGESISYDTLIIATGVRPRLVGTAITGGRTHTLHTALECYGLRAALVGAQRVAVIGGGFIGSEIAATVRELGRDVELISSTRHPLERVMGTWAGQHVARVHEANGVQLRMSTRVTDVSATSDGVRVNLADGGTVEADIAIIGIGSSPATQWLENSGLDIHDGVVVDSDGRTQDESIWAIGDIARRRAEDGSTLRVEHWTSATEQADALARLLLGKPPVTIPKLDYLWTDMYGFKIQMFGHIPAGAQEHVLLEEEGKFIVAYTVDGRLCAVVGRGVAGRFMRFRTAVAAGHPVDELIPVAA